MKTLFLDESGHHDLSFVDVDYPVFVLAGVICDSDYASREMEERVRGFKLDLFGTPDIVLHTADIVRSKNGFERLNADREFRQRFYKQLNELMRTLAYSVVACVIKKREHIARYGPRASDPYHFSLQPLVERFCFDIGSVPGGGQIIAESRRPDLDRQLGTTFEHLRENGTFYMNGAKIRHRISQLCCRPKRLNIAGLQIADLVASPIGRYVIGKPIREDFRIVSNKFRGGPSGFCGKGLIVLPKN